MTQNDDCQYQTGEANKNSVNVLKIINNNPFFSFRFVGQSWGQSHTKSVCPVRSLSQIQINAAELGTIPFAYFSHQNIETNYLGIWHKILLILIVS